MQNELRMEISLVFRLSHTERVAQSQADTKHNRVRMKNHCCCKLYGTKINIVLAFSAATGQPDRSEPEAP